MTDAKLDTAELRRLWANAEDAAEIANVMNAIAEQVESMSDEQVLADAKFEGLDAKAEAERIRQLLLAAARRPLPRDGRSVLSPGPPESKWDPDTDPRRCKAVSDNGHRCLFVGNHDGQHCTLGGTRATWHLWETVPPPFAQPITVAAALPTSAADEAIVDAAMPQREVKPMRISLGPECAGCGDTYALRPGDEPTRYCVRCAHELVDELRAERDSLRAEVEHAKARDDVVVHMVKRLEEDRDAATKNAFEGWAHAGQVQKVRDSLLAERDKERAACEKTCEAYEAQVVGLRERLVELEAKCPTCKGYGYVEAPWPAVTTTCMSCGGVGQDSPGAKCAATKLSEAYSEMNRNRERADAAEARVSEQTQWLDAIAAALHPHWQSDRNAYAPGQLAGMIRKLVQERDIAKSRT